METLLTTQKQQHEMRESALEEMKDLYLENKRQLLNMENLITTQRQQHDMRESAFENQLDNMDSQLKEMKGVYLETKEQLNDLETLQMAQRDHEMTEDESMPLNQNEEDESRENLNELCDNSCGCLSRLFTCCRHWHAIRNRTNNDVPIEFKSQAIVTRK